MTQFHPPDSTALKDKVVVLTGGALGVGAALVRLLHALGAHVFFGDVLDQPAFALEKELSASGRTHVKFVHCDVTSYSDNLALFDAAYETCGRIDHAVAVAGLGEQGSFISPNLTLESVREEPKRAMSVVDINLKGPLYFSRLASVYLRQPGLKDKSSTDAADKSLTLVASVAGFREDPGLFVYTPSKHGVLGILRAFRSALSQSKPHPIRTNAICPWMTRTRLVAGLEDVWAQHDLPANEPEDVAKMIVGVLADTKLIGETLYVEGGRGWLIEQKIRSLMPQWLGEKQTRDLDKGTEIMGGGEGWTVGQEK